MIKEKYWLPLLLVLLVVVAALFVIGFRLAGDVDAAAPAASASAAAALRYGEYDLTFSDRDFDASYEEVTAEITLAENGFTVTGANAYAAGDTLYIIGAGTFVLSGSLDAGRIVVEAAGSDKIQLVLNNVRLYAADTAALYIKQADKVFLTLPAGTENSLGSGAVYSAEAIVEDITATVFSRANLTINGTGALCVTAEYRHGIETKDSLVITGGELTVEATADALRGRDCIKAADGALTLVAGEDGMQSSNDENTDAGFVYLSGGSYQVTAGNDGIQAETVLLIEDGIFNIVANGGAVNAEAHSEASDFFANRRQRGAAAPEGETMTLPEDWAAEQPAPPADDGYDLDDVLAASAADSVSASYKGLKAGLALLVTGGEFTLDCADDALHCDGDIMISGGSLQLASGDDAVHADGALRVSGGRIEVSRAYEGLEGRNVTIDGGTVLITCSDDGINASDGSGGMMMRDSGSVCSLTINKQRRRRGLQRHAHVQWRRAADQRGFRRREQRN